MRSLTQWRHGMSWGGGSHRPAREGDWFDLPTFDRRQRTNGWV